MAGTGKKWFMGCGIGCAVVVLIILGIGAGGFFFVRNSIEKMEAIGDTQDQLEDELGALEDFTPSPDGRIAADAHTSLPIRYTTSSSSDPPMLSRFLFSLTTPPSDSAILRLDPAPGLIGQHLAIQ